MVCLELRIIVLNEIGQTQVTNTVFSLMFGIERKTRQNNNKTRTWQEEGLLFEKSHTALAHGQRATDNSGSPAKAVNATMLTKQVDSQALGVQKQKFKQKSGIQFPGKSLPSLCRLF